jgi:hypothetical protein
MDLPGAAIGIYSPNILSDLMFAISLSRAAMAALSAAWADRI